MPSTLQEQPPPPKISLLSNLWIVIPITALIFAILSNNMLLLNYVHVFNAVLWTGTDIFTAFLLGLVLRNVSLNTKRSHRLAYAKDGILHANHCIYFEMRKNEPDMSRVQRLMKIYVKVVAIQATLQFIIIFIMAEFAIGFFLNQ
jgi:hypothetical protein